jgi:thiamine pyrophosphokinase
MKSVLIYLGGNGPAQFPSNIDKSSIMMTIAADSGVELAQQHGTNVDILVGDLDSANCDAIEIAKKSGAKIIQFACDKDLTDFELAIIEANKLDAERLIVIGGGGKRSDHLLANISVMCGTQTEKFIVEAYFDNELVYVCRSNQKLELQGDVGDTISLLPLGGNVKNVKTTGLKWDLNNQELNYSNALGISNLFSKEKITIKIEDGILIVIKQI